VIRILIATGIRLYREGLAEMLGRYEDLEVVGTASSCPETMERAGELQPAVLLLDMTLPEALRTMTAVAEKRPQTSILALALAESETRVLACAEAGAAGFVPREASVEELVAAVRDSVRGEMRCSPRMAHCLMRRVRALAGSRQTAWSAPRPHVELTPRQRQIVEMIDSGLSNKEIARALVIEVSTVKNHVHNILEKLQVRRRAQAAAVLRSIRARL